MAIKKPSLRQVVWTAIIGFGSILGVVVAIWGWDYRYVQKVPHAELDAKSGEILELKFKEVHATMKQIQQTDIVKDARGEVQFWLRQEVLLESACDDAPSNTGLRRKYKRAKRERQKAEQRLRDEEAKQRIIK
jgi:hypothetical protein